jgi:galactonate dehydratase
MKITDIKTFLMMAGAPKSMGRRSAESVWTTRNWCFVKVYTDEGITGIGEGSGWPRVIQTAIEDMKPILIGEDPTHIERLWQKMLVSTMGNGMTGTPGSGAINAIDMALWDIKGKALNTPVWNLLGGKVRDKVRAYGHASTPERALELKAQGLTGIKTGGVANTVDKVEAIRKAVGDEIDIMVDAHGPPWFTTKDAIIVGKALEQFNLLFYEDPVPPDNMDALRRVQDNVDIPIAAGERHSHIWGVRQLIEDEIVDVVQPDTGRIGGISQMMKLSAMAEAHFITVAPHSGSLGPVAEYAAIHVLAAIPNALILERVHDDVPVRYEVVQPHIPSVDGYITVPDRPGLGVDIDEEVVAANPSHGNTTRGGSPADPSYEPGTYHENVYYQSRYRRQKTMWKTR